METIGVDIKALKGKHIDIVDCKEINDYDVLNNTLLALYNSGVTWIEIAISQLMAEELKRRFDVENFVISPEGIGSFNIKGVTHIFKEV